MVAYGNNELNASSRFSYRAPYLLPAGCRYRHGDAAIIISRGAYVTTA